MRLKVCGMTSVEQIRELDYLGVEFCGLIFYPKSPRFVKKFHLSAIDLRNQKMKINKVGVFVNADAEEVLRTVDLWRLEMVQLHGDETPKFCEKLSGYITTIKAIRVGPSENIQRKLDQYSDSCDMFLFDTVGGQYGGTGEKFDWELLKQAEIPLPYFLSGGIALDDAFAVKEFNAISKNLFAVDVNSRFEISPGVKDVNKIASFKKLIID